MGSSLLPIPPLLRLSFEPSRVHGVVPSLFVSQLACRFPSSRASHDGSTIWEHLQCICGCPGPEGRGLHGRSCEFGPCASCYSIDLSASLETELCHSSRVPKPLLIRCAKPAPKPRLKTAASRHSKTPGNTWSGKTCRIRRVSRPLLLWRSHLPPRPPPPPFTS